MGFSWDHLSLCPIYHATSASHAQHSPEWLERPPSGYEFSLMSRTDSTLSNIPGVGRVLGNLMRGAGQRIEPVISRAAEGLGLGPNAAAQRIVDVILSHHSRQHWLCKGTTLRQIRARQALLDFIVSRAGSPCPDCGICVAFHATSLGKHEENDAKQAVTELTEEYKKLLSRLVRYLRYDL